jgi:hypothetical protein
MWMEASNHLKLLWSKAMVVSVKEKGSSRKDQVFARETNKTELLWKCRNQNNRHQNQS